jgi:hypothetical protein
LLRKGKKKHGAVTVTSVTEGAMRKIIPAVLLNTLPFLTSTARSFNGWKMPGPRRPEAMLFVLRMIPGKKRAAITIRTKPAIPK